MLAGSNFVPSAQLACYFGDEQAAATFVHSSSLRCDAPRRAAPAHVQLCVASLGTPGGACAPFAFYGSPTLTELTPRVADKDETSLLRIGGTNLPPGTAASCAFGGMHGDQVS